MSVDLGYVPAGSTIYIPFTTHAQTGAAIAPLTAYEAADVRLYKNGSATERSSQAGWTMTSPFDSITGLHLLAIDLSDNTDSGFYSDGGQYFAVLSADTETIDGLVAVAVLATFTIGPVAAEAKDHTGAALATAAQASGIQADTDDIQTRLPAALVGGRIDASVGAMAANVLTAAAAASDFGDEVADAVWDEATSGHGSAGTTGKALTDAGGAGTPPTADEIADAVWEEDLSDHSGTAGSTAEQLAAAGASGDPWATALPGTYSSGQAGKIVGDNLDATVSSRAPEAGGNLADVKTKTDNLPADPASESAIEAAITAAAGESNGAWV